MLHFKVKPWCSLQEVSPPAQTTLSTLCPSLEISLLKPSLQRQAPTLATVKRICWKMILQISVLPLLTPHWTSSNDMIFRQKEEAPRLRVVYYFSAKQLCPYPLCCFIVSLTTVNVQLYLCFFHIPTFSCTKFCPFFLRWKEFHKKIKPIVFTAKFSQDYSKKTNIWRVL